VKGLEVMDPEIEAEEVEGHYFGKGQAFLGSPLSLPMG
jgi:hypothetical protein